LPTERGDGSRELTKILNLPLPDGIAGGQGGKGIMLGWAIAFLIIALIAGVLGFTGLAGTAMWIAKVIFVVFLILFVLMLLFGRRPV
jgi:uncharacterized membrane protein YtjA (UPF0391 family)